tara:strand:- start:125 stop:298 length:174 start_codon:yes stop_codon:yes gene_type:complete
MNKDFKFNEKQLIEFIEQIYYCSANSSDMEQGDFYKWFNDKGKIIYNDIKNKKIYRG